MNSWERRGERTDGMGEVLREGIRKDEEKIERERRRLARRERLSWARNEIDETKRNRVKRDGLFRARP